MILLCYTVSATCDIRENLDFAAVRLPKSNLIRIEKMCLGYTVLAFLSLTIVILHMLTEKILIVIQSFRVD